MIKLKCYDKYNKCHYLIDFDNDGYDDEIGFISYSSRRSTADQHIVFLAVDGEDPTPSRWSDLEQFEIVN